MSKSFLNDKTLPRGLRNNNPGNLVLTSIPWKGKIPLMLNTDKHFEQFENVHYGIRAMMRDIKTDFSKGLTSVTKLINEYAPSFENNTTAYINTVIQIVGTNEISVLNQNSIIALAKAIHYVENGSNYYNYLNDDDFKIGFNMAFPSGLNIQAPKKKELVENYSLITLIIAFLIYAIFKR